MITGSSGKLGSELKKLFPEAKDPADVNFISFDLRNAMSIKHAFLNILNHAPPPKLLIHCAAMTDVSKCEENPFDCYETNAIGTFLLAKACKIWGAKMVYISTDHVFDGKNNSPYYNCYSEDDKPNPIGHYAKSKLMGEWFVLSDPNNLVIRTSFMKDFPFERAYTDKHFNAEKVSVIAKKIAKAIDMNLTGIYHIAGHPKSVYDLAKTMKSKVKPMELKDRPTNPAGLKYLKDTTLDINKWEEACKKK